MTVHWNEKSLAKYDEKVSVLISDYTNHPEKCSVHIGTNNRKTKMIDEGTSAGLCGTCDRSCKGDCREMCYAIVHMDGVFTKCLKNHAQNTVMRRRDPIAYYTTFFEFANKKNKSIRVNETGDFETAKDIYTLMEVARKYPNVRVIGYTKRANLLCEIAELNKLENVMIHFSLACHGDNSNVAVAFGVPVTRITLDPKKCTCPNQIAVMNGKTHHCEMCAKLGIGCFVNKDITFLAH